MKWDEFTHILEEEGALREKILDLKLDDISIKRFKEVFKRFVRVKYGQLSENSNAMVDQLIKIRVKDKDYYVITFDDRDVRFARGIFAIMSMNFSLFRSTSTIKTSN